MYWTVPNLVILFYFLCPIFLFFPLGFKFCETETDFSWLIMRLAFVLCTVHVSWSLQNLVETGFTCASLKFGLFCNFAQAHSFYLVLGAALSNQAYVLLPCVTSSINFQSVFSANSHCKLPLLLILAGDIEINLDQVRIPSLVINQ